VILGKTNLSEWATSARRIEPAAGAAAAANQKSDGALNRDSVGLEL